MLTTRTITSRGATVRSMTLDLFGQVNLGQTKTTLTQKITTLTTPSLSSGLLLLLKKQIIRNGNKVNQQILSIQIYAISHFFTYTILLRTINDINILFQISFEIVSDRQTLVYHHIKNREIIESHIRSMKTLKS